MAKPLGTRMPFADRRPYISPSEAFLPPTRGTSSMPIASKNLTKRGVFTAPASPEPCRIGRGQSPERAVGASPRRGWAEAGAQRPHRRGHVVVIGAVLGVDRDSSAPWHRGGRHRPHDPFVRAR